jgi:hypothetical protein
VSDRKSNGEVHSKTTTTATLYFDTVHDFIIGDSVVISNCGSAWNGTKTITAVATLTDKKVDLNTSMILTYESGAHATLSTTMASRGSVSAMIAGDKARLELDGYFYAPTSYRLITRDGEVIEFPKNYEGNGLREEAAEFARVVISGEIESPLMTHATSLLMMEQMDQIREQIGVRYPGE